MELQEKQIEQPDVTPLVTIRCATYNHEPYIRQCLEGFVMQKTTFPFEAIVHDDASTDGTTAIIREYAERYPNIIKPIYETENQYSKHDGSLSRIMDAHTRGKYIAMCEGDDYWTDPLKLQKQVDLLENNPSASLCCGGYIRKQSGVHDKEVIYRKDNAKYFSFDLDSWKKVWYTKTLTVLYRYDALSSYRDKYINQYSYNRDTHVIYNLLKWGNGIYLSEILGVYNLHQGGVWSLIPQRKKNIDFYNIYKELFEAHRDSFLRRSYFRSILRRMVYESHQNELFSEGWNISISYIEKILLIFYFLSPSFLLRLIFAVRRKLLLLTITD